MKRICLIAIGMLMLASIAMPAQQVATAGAGAMASAEQQLKTLSAKLDLSPAQQEKIKPVLEHLRDATLKLMQDDSLTQEERLARIRPERFKARDEIRAALTDGQQKKLDDYLRGPHNELHGNLTGNAQP